MEIRIQYNIYSSGRVHFLVGFEKNEKYKSLQTDNIKGILEVLEKKGYKSTQIKIFTESTDCQVIGIRYRKE